MGDRIECLLHCNYVDGNRKMKILLDRVPSREDVIQYGDRLYQLHVKKEPLWLNLGRDVELWTTEVSADKFKPTIRAYSRRQGRRS